MTPSGGQGKGAASARGEAARRDAARKEPRDAATQRVRVGLTGLAAVFLLTILAASVFNMLGQDDRAPGRTGGNSAIANAEDSPREPLAELGMAPGNAPKTPVAQPQSRPIPVLTPAAPVGPGLVPAAAAPAR